ncbi:MAG: phosphate uptake regulator PhoU [Methanomicrobiales archaeon]
MIRLTTKQRFPPFVRKVVRDFSQMTVGQEVVEETESVIVIKNLLDLTEIPFENTIKHMFVIAKTMHDDAVTALETRNMSLAEDVVKRDMDVDRLNWLIARQTNMIMQNASLLRKMRISTTLAMHYYIISWIIERIGDHAVRMAENTQPIIYLDLDKKILAAIKKASSLSMENFDRSIISFFNADMKDANRNIESIHSLEAICGEINNMVLKQDTLVAIHVGYIAESVRRAGEYSCDISETVINLLIEKENGPP